MTKSKASPVCATFDAGLSCGRRTAELLPRMPPFSVEQREWLNGFLLGLLSTAEGHGEQAEHPGSGTHSRQGSSPCIGPDRWSPYAAPVREVAAVEGSGRPLHRIVLDLEGSRVRYQAGGWLGVCPQNDPDCVRQLLRILGARGQEEVVTARAVMPLWRALLEELDIQRVTPELLESMATAARSREEMLRLRQLSDEGFGSEPSVTALLKRFPSARPSAQSVVSSLLPLEPCLYPIASAPAQAPLQVEVAVLMGDPAEDPPCGLVSSFLARRLRPGDWLPVFAEQSQLTLPADTTTPVIFFGEGLGLALCRSLLEERVATGARRRNWVVAGDGAFSSTFAHLQATGALTRWTQCYDPRTSGESGATALAGLLDGQAEPLWRWLVDRSTILVSGPLSWLVAVQDLLLHLVAHQGRMGPDRARLYLEELREEGRLLTQSVG